MKNKLFILFFFISIFLMGFLPVKDTDFGWHYRCGNQFLTTGKLCLTNEFSYFLPNYKAYYTGHLYDIILAFIYNYGGFLAVSILGSLIFVLSAYIFLKLVQGDVILKIIGFFAVFFLSYSIFNLGLRPQIISFLFFSILLFILNHKNKKLLFVLPFFFLIWVNIHIGFFVGLAVLLFCLFEQKFNTIKDYLLVLTLSFIATLINPFGILVYKEILNHAFAPLNTMIAEWVAPTLPHIVLIVTLSIIGLIKIVRKKPFSLYQILLLIFFSVLALQARRNLPLFYITASYVLLNDIKLKTERIFSLFIPLLTTLSIFVAIILIPQTIDFSTSWNSYCNKGLSIYPCEAIKKYPHLSGNVYASYEWGGYLIWQKPDMKVFADGRMSAWKDSEGKYSYQKYLEILQTKNYWNGQLRKLKTDYILIAPGTFLDLLLQKDAQKYHWKEVYRDNFAVIYKSTI